MAHLPEKPDFEEGIYQIELTDPVVGGVEGISNRQARQLANRTRWLRLTIEQIIKGVQVVAKATRLETARKLILKGAATGEASFDGSVNAVIELTLANSGAKAGTYPVVTINAKGLAVAGRALSADDVPGLPWAKITSGKPTTLAGYGITDALPASSFNWLNLPGKPATYPPANHTHPWGSISATPTTLAGYGISEVPGLIRTTGWRTSRAAPADGGGGDFNLITTPGCHDVLMHGSNRNGPGGGYYYVQVFEYAGVNLTQLLIPYTIGSLLYRHRYNGTWSDFVRVLDTSNFASVAAPAAHSHAWAAITGKPTSLGGYGITDAFPRAGGAFGGRIYTYPTSGPISAPQGTYRGGLEVRSEGVSEAGNAAFIAFHRPGLYATYFGLDTDNKFKLGGWSMGAVAHELVHAGNFHEFSGMPGQIAAFARSTPPPGWLKANGTAVSRTGYARLFAAIGTRFGAGDGKTSFNLPDLRGEFIRGWDDARGIDPNRVYGSVQAQSIQSHTHAVKEGHVGVGPGTENLTSGDDYTGAIAYWSTSSATGGPETRPRNFALLLCIKY